MTLWRLLSRALRPYWVAVTAVGLCQVMQSVASLFLPTLNAAIIDDGVARGDTGLVLKLGAAMLGITLIQVAASVAAVYFGARAAMGLGHDLRDQLFAHVNEFSEREVSFFGGASLITRSTNDVQQVQTLAFSALTLLVSAPILAVGGVVLALQLDLPLSWVIAVSVPTLLIALGAIIARMVPQFRLMQGRIDTVNRVLREQLTGVRVVRAFVRERREMSRFTRANTDVTDSALRAGNLMALMFPTVVLILNASSVAVVWFGGIRVDEGSIQVGTLIAFLSYLVQILMAVMMSTFVAMMIPRAAICADRITEVLSTPTSIAPTTAPVDAIEGGGRVELRGAGFVYPGAEEAVLHELDLVVEPGEVVAVVGSTGSGKTTLVNLLPRLFDTTSGQVLVGGVDVREVDPEVLWQNVALVPQKSLLFSGTVASNLRFGNADATDDELWRALEIAQAADFVRSMEGQLDAPITQGGATVSGGQRQRLAIARALVKRAPLYIFDDSFSALDLATDARLRTALRREMGGTTMVIVAQRVASIADADRIIVLESGRIVANGRHDELLGGSPTYREIVASQEQVEDAG